MKHILTTALLLSATIGKAQTLEHSYTAVSVSPVLFSAAGIKIAMKDSANASPIKIYNSDYTTLWKTINLPTYPGFRYQMYQLLSDNLFNLDNSVELVVTYISTTTSGLCKTVVLSETGSVIFDLGNTIWHYAWYIDGTYKLHTGGTSDYSTKVYSLPGTLPCGHCGGATGLPKPGRTGLSAPVPNPTSGTVNIPYTLPADTYSGMIAITDVNGRLMQSHVVNASAESIQINTANLAPGNYTVTLTGGNATPASVMLTVTK